MCGSTCLAAAYNSLIERALSLPEPTEALVLLHDNVLIHDRNFIARVVRLLRDPHVAVA